MFCQIFRGPFPSMVVLGLLACPVVAQEAQPADSPALPTLPPAFVTAPFPASPEVALTPTRTESPLREFGGSVTIIGAPQILNSEQPFLRDL